MKNYRLVIHEKNFSDEDLVINSKDYPEAKEGDIVEIYDPNEEINPRLLLQIREFKDDLSKDTISIKSSIAATFGLRTFAVVCMSIKDPISVALDSIELTFKDQYMGRSDMWRLKRSLTNSCVYLNKKLEFCGGALRCQVYEMWSQGDRVACGVINDDTKVVFRSSTSMVYLFLQMSSEMWDFDIYGDLYFEKAVNGFLADLFQKWKKNGSNHEVTIVLFSRTFYEANTLEEFPLHMRECLQKDYKGRYYEDFYRVGIQNERYDDWSGILVQLRRVFSEYLKVVLEYHKRPGQIIPAANNSTAAQGNFLEVLNMSLNVFEKHYLDRSFDRTGQLSVVLTPGVGVFEVDRELTNITKQRIIDNGVGSDLVCVGEQPLHAVPLLKFHNKDTHLNVPDDYSMPHWINLSFYSTNKKIAYSTFIPRIKLPPSLDKNCDNVKASPIIGQNTASIGYGGRNLLPDEDCIHNSFFDYDAYDAQVFQLPAAHSVHEYNGYHRTTKCKRSSGGLLDANDLRGQRRKLSDPDIQHSFEVHSSQRSQPIAIRPAATSPVVSPKSDGLDKVLNGIEKELSPPLRMVVGSEGSPPLDSKALINPFDPSHVTIKLTSNRRRWTHIFPKGPTGVLIQQHHYQAVPTQQPNQLDSSEESDKGFTCSGTKNISVAALHEYCKKRPSTHPHIPGINVHPKNPSKSLTLLWGATGEQEWTPALTTVNDIIIGVDWKSLTISACLPITTDYFPDKRALQIDYVVSQYNLLPDDVNADYAQQRAIYKKPLTTAEVFRELVSQRLAQGFQLILMLPKGQAQTHSLSSCVADHALKPIASMFSTGVTSTSLLRKRAPEMEDCETYCLSIGRLFHKISLSGNSITVTRYRPRHPYPGFNYQYRYRFHAPHHDTYEESYASFTTEKLEHYNWNYLDHYICTRGDTDFVLVDALKYWRFRVYLLPLNNAATKRIIEGASHCDIYTVARTSEHQQIVDGFLKFVETIVNYNKIKRPAKTRNNVAANSPYRERLGSNRIPERPRQRPGFKAIERACWPDISQSTIHDNGANDPNVEDSNSAQTEPILKSVASHVEILEAMKNFDTGVGFLNTHQSLPTYTFVSSEAANWIYSNMEGVSSVDKAVQILRNMHKAELICHASGDFCKLFYYGFYLYYIVRTNPDDKDYCPPLGDLQTFENEWLEVEIRPALNWGLPLSSTNTTVPVVGDRVERERCVPHFLCDDIDFNYVIGDTDFDSVYKRMHLEIDISNKSDRAEWGHARYQTVFRSDQAYELVIEWLTASGSIVAEMLSWWMRKAQSCGLQLVPIPHDPLALPYSNKSDPLRGPIFIPLNTKCLEEPDLLFKEFREDTTFDRIFLFQEAIISRFGFVKCLVEPTTNGVATSAIGGTSCNASGIAGGATCSSGAAATMSTEHQYIHCTGTIFILISSPASKNRHRLGSASLQPKRHIKVQNTHTLGLKIPPGRYSDHADVVPSPHEAYITRHVSGKNKDDYDNSRRMGFLWSWNHMVSKRWRTNQSVDNNFQVKLLRDFREFCANFDDRLRNYWEESWEIKESASSTY